MADTSKRYRRHKGVTYIDLNLRHINQLFDSLDPSPFLERDLDDNAVDYIVSATMEHSPRTEMSIAIHLSEPEKFQLDPKVVVESVHNYFSYSEELATKKLKTVFRRAQFAFLVGSLLLTICLFAAQTFASDPTSKLKAIIREGLVIMGWVAMWRPIDIFLYSWWPQVEMRNVYRRLSKVPVEIAVAPKPGAR